MFNFPQDDDTYSWTNHSFQKMAHYAVPPSRVKRIIRFPERTEEGIAEDTIAVMQTVGTTKKQEIWVMYKLAQNERGISKSKFQISKQKNGLIKFEPSNKKIRIITVWRYPGVSSKRDPIPQEVLNEIRALL
jgi:hypothetical protein